LSLLFFFIIGFLPQRFLLELDFSESGFAYPVIRPPIPLPPPPPLAATVLRPIPRGPAERFWAEYVPLANSGDEGAALRLLTDYLDRYPEDGGATLEYGRALWRAERLDEAIDAYRRAVALGVDGEAILELVRLHVAARRWNEALAMYESLAVARSDNRAFLQEYADAATWAEHYDVAAALYARLVESEPDDTTLRLKWARVLYWSGHPELATKVLDGLAPNYVSASADSLRAAIAIALPPPDTFRLSLLEQARGLAMEGAVDSALALYRQHLGAQPGADTVLLEMADAFEYSAGEPDSAVVYLREYLAVRPNAQTVRLRLARLLAWSGRYDEAWSAAQRIVESEPSNAEAWALLGDVDRWNGDFDGSREAYEEALGVDPEMPGAIEGIAALDARVDAALAERGNIGPDGGVDYFSDSDNFGLARLRAGWLFGSPRKRAGVAVAVERLSGFDLAGRHSELTALDVAATAQRWWLGLDARMSLGLWIPESTASVEPVLSLALAVPDWGGAAYRFEYAHEPAYRQTNTLEAAAANLRADVAGLEFFKPLATRWNLTASAGMAYFTGLDDTNLRADGSLGLSFTPGGSWSLGYRTLGLGFRDPAPVSGGGRRMYWDPEWYWLNAGVVNYNGALGGKWELAAQALVGAAWIQERQTGSTLEAQFGIWADVTHRFGVWNVVGSTAVSQSRADGYRAFRFEIGASRGFGR
jgi:Flp pilus assembly protein TadD